MIVSLSPARDVDCIAHKSVPSCGCTSKEDDKIGAISDAGPRGRGGRRDHEVLDGVPPGQDRPVGQLRCTVTTARGSS